MAVKSAAFSEVAIVANDAHLAAKLSCVLAVPRKYLPILEQPRLTRPDREGEVIRCTNALARTKANNFVFAGLGAITSTAFATRIPTRNTFHVRTENDISDLQLHAKQFSTEPLAWGKEHIGVGLLKALRTGCQICFTDNTSKSESISPKNGHLIVCEEGEDLAQVIAANLAFALGAGLHIIPSINQERTEAILEQFYGANDNPEKSVSDTLANLREELRALAGPVPVPVGGSITFIVKALPLGFAFPEVPSTHLFLSPTLGITIVNGLFAAQSEGPGTRVATLVNPQVTPAPEIDTAISLLSTHGIYLRKYEGEVADVTSIAAMIELFPYDLLLIATHCGDVSGSRWTYEYEDSEGYKRILVVDIGLGIGGTEEENLLHVTRFISFVSLDGVEWNNQAEKEKLYVGKAISSFIELTVRKSELQPVRKVSVPRVSGSAALAMADGNLIALPHTLACENSPIVMNNACVSWHRLAKDFMFGGASSYIGTLIPVTSGEASEIVKRLLGKYFGKSLSVALWAAQRDVYGLNGRMPYIMMGVFPQRLKASRTNAPRYIMKQLARGLLERRQILARAKTTDESELRTLKSQIKYYERELVGYRQRWLSTDSKLGEE